MTTMTTISLYNRTAVELHCEPSSTVQVRVPGAPVDEDLLAQGGTVFVELDPATSPLETVVTLHGSNGDTYVWEATASGGHALWARDAGGRSHRTCGCPTDANVQVVALASGSPPPAAPPAPGSGQAILTVKVRKKGDLPIE